MKTNKITQRKAVFYILWKSFKEDPNTYVPAWKFVGELHIPEINKYFFMSYKCPANGVNIFFENPGLIDRRETVGKSGAKYYEYRIAPYPSPDKIKDETLLKFHKLIKYYYHKKEEKK